MTSNSLTRIDYTCPSHGKLRRHCLGDPPIHLRIPTHCVKGVDARHGYTCICIFRSQDFFITHSGKGAVRSDALTIVMTTPTGDI